MYLRDVLIRRLFLFSHGCQISLTMFFFNFGVIHNTHVFGYEPHKVSSVERLHRDCNLRSDLRSGHLGRDRRIWTGRTGLAGSVAGLSERDPIT